MSADLRGHFIILPQSIHRLEKSVIEMLHNKSGMMSHVEML
jgi:hypothetical protein